MNITSLMSHQETLRELNEKINDAGNRGDRD